MATPTTAAQWEMANEAFRHRLWRRKLLINDLLIRPPGGIIRTALERDMPTVFRWGTRRPHTDDMMQLCADLGVEVPDAPPYRSVITLDYASFSNLTLTIEGQA